MDLRLRIHQFGISLYLNENKFLFSNKTFWLSHGRHILYLPVLPAFTKWCAFSNVCMKSGHYTFLRNWIMIQKRWFPYVEIAYCNKFTGLVRIDLCWNVFGVVVNISKSAQYTNLNRNLHLLYVAAVSLPGSVAALRNSRSQAAL
jgi:hypothetical protein